MFQISVVIITKNEAENIVRCLRSAKMISNDIIVVDSESSDNTVWLAKSEGATVITEKWKGYGNARNIGASNAKFNWIMAMDADEVITEKLAQSIKNIEVQTQQYVFKIKRLNYLADKKIQFGAFGSDKVIRIYNRQNTAWDLSPVHEKLLVNAPYIKEIEGCLIHLGKQSLENYKCKMQRYAKLCAYKYLQQGKKASVAKRYFSPVFNFTKSYFFQLGFLDGKEGFELAKIIGRYTWQKYYYLHLLNHSIKEDGYLNLYELNDNSDITIP